MRIIPLLVCAAALTTGAAAQANIPVHICEGVAQGIDGEQVITTLTVSEDGATNGFDATWAPPQRANGPALSPEAPDLTLWIPLDVGPPIAILQSRNASVFLTYVAPLGKQVSDSALMRGASQFTLKISFDHLSPVTPDLLPPELGPPGSAFTNAGLRVPSGTRSVNLVAIDKKGRQVRRIDFDLTNVVQRNRLFEAAKAAAQAAAVNYQSCGVGD